MQTRKHFKTKLLDNGILLLGFDQKDKPVNLLSSDVLEELGLVVKEILVNEKVKGVVPVSLKNSCFIAGADINELKSVTSREECEQLVRKALALLASIENSNKPFVAAIEGVCMGGGLEFALACHWRVASDHLSTVLALPEVQLGIIPGFWGTQRLPKLIGVGPALEIIASGKSVFPKKALRIKLIDDLVANMATEKRTIDNIENEALVSVAIQRAHEIASGQKKKRKIGIFNRFLGWPLVKNAVGLKAKKDILAKTGGHYPAPLRAVSAVISGNETRHLLDLITSQVAKNLMGIFLATQELKPAKQNMISPHKDRIGVLGSGLMGSQITANLVETGYTAVMKDIGAPQLCKGMDRIDGIERKDLERQIISPAEFDRRLLRIRPTLDMIQLRDLSIVIEAVSEQLAIKKILLKEFEGVASKDAIFATNTSSYTVAEIAADAKHKERCVAMHFFNPIKSMRLVEIGVAPFTNLGTLTKVLELARQMGKIPIIVRDSPGFIVNRILARYLIEAIILKSEGVCNKDIDSAAKKFGMAVDSGRVMGPLELIDFVGVETCLHVIKSLKRLGSRFEDRPEFADMLRAQNRPERTNLSQQVITNRLILPMADEGIRCLAEDVVDSPEKIDMAMLYGAGFPAFTGGLLKWARDWGLDKMRDRLEELAGQYGSRFTPYENFKNLN
ncbi:MAG: hypothetical protein A2750_02515 [Candidatus Yanofskybacteria bacterium RIFCSPHIGHO2_01_FULL_45_42]|uniref:enoyl-CoA hydratase n=2 Tax=Candidatus Yanofskyibacteriota TaxID=1752733 RepID=A0A1F8FJV2_9BACT|nr:MAG: hypothetical protein A2750_02515 [Candidatus Yanofskybacteria bacterium RIFCSPHIGHO2_01_FULL_45_42]OGN13335.1 MAG: hypothetical protein A3J47_03720 [Candidatus Yanofskybacteria bacterium RIFCSPHIGHO2_02_FULL_43_22]